MKKISSIAIISVLLLLTLPLLLAQDKKDLSSEAIQAVQKGDARGLSQCFGNSIDLVLPGSEGIRSRTQAEMVLREFFQNNPPTAVNVKHQGSSLDGASFVIASYQSSNRQYRVYFLIREGSEGMKIRQLKIDQQ